MNCSMPGFPVFDSPRICSNSCLLSWWCHPTISFSVALFSSFPPSFPASGSFPMSQFFASCDQSTGALASTSVFPMNIQGWLPLGLTGLNSLLSNGLSRVFSSITIWKLQFFSGQLSLWPNSHPYMTTGKTIPGKYVRNINKLHGKTTLAISFIKLWGSLDRAIQCLKQFQR